MSLTRRQFLQLAGTFGLAAVFPPRVLPRLLPPAFWPALTTSTLPARQRAILRRMPDLEVDQNGIFRYRPGTSAAVPLPAAQTQWNLENANRWDQLEAGYPWAIVLHWFGDNPDSRQSVSTYLNGFNGLRRIEDYETRTSAHALVGTAHPGYQSGTISILQTQMPYTDGTPLVASHLGRLDYQAHSQRLQYFVRGLYTLSHQEPSVHSVLQDWFDGPVVDPNMRSLGIELTGRDLDTPGSYPSDQQVANTVALVAAMMRRYQVLGSNLLGHNEIAINKPDPGKKFMALIRCLLGALALTSNEPNLKDLLFAQYLGEHGDPEQAVRAYFQFGRDYLLLTGHPHEVYEWESQSGYWGLADQLPGSTHTLLPTARIFKPPLPGAQPLEGATFLNPHNHAGVDLYLPASSASAVTNVQLSAPGQCLYAGPSRYHHTGHQAIFRHRQPDGAEVLSLYANLSSLGTLQPGTVYPAGQTVGQLSGGQGKTFLLHFGIAYGATWELDLQKNPYIPLNASVGWISLRFMDPVEFLEERGG
jgi:hypothetical protein